MSYLAYLRSFHSVYRQGSISRAAEELGLSQPAISQHMRLLESRLGAQLFERVGRGIRATPAANELHRSAGSHIEALEAVLAPQRQSREALAGTVLLGLPGGWASFLMPHLLPAQAQGIRLSLHSGTPPALLDMLATAKLQVLVTTAPIPHKTVVYETLHAGPVLLVAAPALHARLPRTGPPRTLPVVDQQGPASTLQSYWAQCHDEAPPTPVMVTPDHATALAAAKAGIGLAALPACLCREALSAGALVALKPPRKAPQSLLYLARCQQPRPSAREAWLRELLLEAARLW